MQHHFPKQAFIKADVDFFLRCTRDDTPWIITHFRKISSMLNYLPPACFAHISRRVTVRLNTNFPEVDSESIQKYPILKN